MIKPYIIVYIMNYKLLQNTRKICLSKFSVPKSKNFICFINRKNFLQIFFTFFLIFNVIYRSFFISFNYIVTVLSLRERHVFFVPPQHLNYWIFKKLSQIRFVNFISEYLTHYICKFVLANFVFINILGGMN